MRTAKRAAEPAWDQIMEAAEVASHHQVLRLREQQMPVHIQKLGVTYYYHHGFN